MAIKARFITGAAAGIGSEIAMAAPAGGNQVEATGRVVCVKFCKKFWGFGEAGLGWVFGFLGQFGVGFGRASLLARQADETASA